MAFSWSSSLLALLAFASLSISFPVQFEERQVSGVTLPSQDSFYDAPAGYEDAAPGAILNYRQIAVPVAIALLAPGVTQSAWQILYRSNDDSGNPLAMVTSMFVPHNGDTNKFFTQSVAYDASDIDCSPSYTLQTLANASPDVAAIALGLNDGWYVQSPDFEGTQAAFTNGIISGQGMLDSLRACLLSTSFTGLSASTRIALNGGSGELVIDGATLGSLTPNVADVLNTVNNGPFAGLIPACITGLAKASTAMHDYLTANLIPAKAADFHSATTRCVTNNEAYFASQDVSSYFQNPNWIQDDVPQSLLNSIGVMGTHGIPQVPLYIYKGAEDELSAVADTDNLVEKYCSEGSPSIIYVRNVVTGHETESFIGFVGAFEYLQERLNGVAPFEGCAIINSTKSTLNSTDSSTLGSLGPQVVKVLNNALPALPSE